jgi:hypothetical protein
MENHSVDSEYICVLYEFIIGAASVRDLLRTVHHCPADINYRRKTLCYSHMEGRSGFLQPWIAMPIDMHNAAQAILREGPVEGNRKQRRYGSNKKD